MKFWYTFLLLVLLDLLFIVCGFSNFRFSALGWGGCFGWWVLGLFWLVGAGVGLGGVWWGFVVCGLLLVGVCWGACGLLVGCGAGGWFFWVGLVVGGGVGVLAAGSGVLLVVLDSLSSICSTAPPALFFTVFLLIPL